MKSIFLSITLFNVFLNVYSQSDMDSLEIQVISETLPSYLDQNPNSPVSYLKANTGYKMFRIVAEHSNDFDSLEQFDSKKALKELDFIADSLAKVFEKKKVQVRVSDTLYTYDYKPKGNIDLRQPEDWSWVYDNVLKEDFEQNSMVRLDTAISLEYADLIKNQIEQSGQDVFLDLNSLNNSVYQFISSDTECKDETLCINGDKIYKPVFNDLKNKACYLFSFRCRHGVCREFIFIEKRDEKWRFVDSYFAPLLKSAD